MWWSSQQLHLFRVYYEPIYWPAPGWRATTSCKSSWDTVPYFGINGLSMILCLWSPLHPLSKSLAIQDHTQTLQEQLWMGGRREVSIISHRPMTRKNLKQERLFFRGSVSTFLQLIVAQLVRALHRHRRGHGSNPRKPEFFRSRSWAFNCDDLPAFISSSLSSNKLHEIHRFW